MNDKNENNVTDFELMISIRSSDLESKALLDLLKVIVTSLKDIKMLEDLKLTGLNTSARLINDRVVSSAKQTLSK